MKKFLGVALVVAGVASGVFGVDYSKMSDNELISQSGKFDPKEALGYFKEIFKRIEKMSDTQARTFVLELEKAKNASEENMLLKDYRARKKAICSELHKEFANTPPPKVLRGVIRDYCRFEGKKCGGKKGERKRGEGKGYEKRGEKACGNCN